ncbi:polyribonucleotide nucleotidyltransferase 1 [Pyrus ussuriensis x Pyrus communis]|uniref:Polyribonucleotide nucleotidyltransferase 1 n=1 Tax=Pyrus ussuriensis x Pyrus communis TaxID=2448454 RepID=A0A5N5FK89_9ROSA|nr:polyribonucleotide nucleotidyltransferase 1 [Pyrus ussuriensis x Pyrus communis]
MILAANAAVGVITETNAEKALEITFTFIVLICRLMDRPLCPTMRSGFYHETQILSWDKEEDKELDPGCALLRPSCVCMSSFTG